jgi:hypothetical protein
MVTTASIAQVPTEILGTWSNSDKTCALDASPDEAFIYTITPKYFSYYEIECLIQDASSNADRIDLNLDCFKGGGIRYFDKIRIDRQSASKLRLNFKEGASEVIRRCAEKPIQETPRSKGQKSQWMHNGSIVSFEETDGNLEIDYLKPRPQLIPLGVREETMLFYGTRTGTSVEGKAYIFNQRCGPLSYEVRGEIFNNGGIVVLKGFAPKVDSKCEIIGKVPDRLQFQRIM